MIKKIALVCGIAIVLSALAVAAGLPAHAAASDTISADALPGLCAPTGQVVVPSNSRLNIVGGTALISSECEIVPGDNASVFIVNAVIDATGGDIDICFVTLTPCGTNVTVHIDSSTIHEGTGFGFKFSRMILRALGSSGQMDVENSLLTVLASPLGTGTISVTSDGTTIVDNTTFIDSTTVIHGGVACHSDNNTPAVMCS